MQSSRRDTSGAGARGDGGLRRHEGARGGGSGELLAARGWANELATRADRVATECDTHKSVAGVIRDRECRDGAFNHDESDRSRSSRGVSDNSYRGQLQGPRRNAHDDFQPLGWGRSASWVNGPDQGRSSLAIDETFSIESIQGSVLFLMSNRFDRFDWIYSLSGSIVHAQVFVRGRGTN